MSQKRETRFVDAFAGDATINIPPIKIYRTGETVQIEEIGPGGKWMGVSFHLLASIVCCNCEAWNPRTRVRGQKYPPLKVAGIHDRHIDDPSQHQRFRVVVFELVPTFPSPDPIKEWGMRQWLIANGLLYYEREEQQENLRKLQTWAEEFLAMDRGTSKRYGVAIAVPEEGEIFGKGAVLEEIERKMTAKGEVERRASVTPFSDLEGGRG